MKNTRVVLLFLMVVLFPWVPSQAMAQGIETDCLPTYIADRPPVPLANPGQIPPKVNPNQNLPPDQRPPMEIQPKITVTSPPVTANKPDTACANHKVTIRFSYFGDIGGAVNIRLDNRTIATGVSVQGGQGSYTWTVQENFSGKGTQVYTVYVEAANGSTVGTGGKYEVIGSKVPSNCGK